MSTPLPLLRAEPTEPAPASRMPSLLRRMRPAVTQLAEVNVLAPRLLHVALEGPGVAQLGDFTRGQEFKFRCGGSWLSQSRNYSPIGVDPARRRLEVVVTLAGTGPGARFWASAAVGQPVSVWGPGDATTIATDARAHLFLGDTSALSVFASLVPVARGSVFGAIQLAPEERSAIGALGLPFAALPLGLAEPEAPLHDYVRDVMPELGHDVHITLIGRARTVSTTAKLLRSLGVPRSRIQARAFWAEGKTGL